MGVLHYGTIYIYSITNTILFSIMTIDIRLAITLTKHKRKLYLSREQQKRGNRQACLWLADPMPSKPGVFGILNVDIIKRQRS